MIYLKSIDIKNAFSIKKGKIRFDGPNGLYLIYGIRNGTIDDSNGTGKSSIIETLNWTLFDETMKKQPVADILKKGERSCSSVVRFDVGSDKYKIKKSRNRTTTKVVIVENGKDISYKDLITNKKKIQKILNMNFGLWSNSVVIGQGKTGALFDGGNKDRKGLFIKLLNLESLDVALEIVRKKLSLFRNKLEHYRGKLSGLKRIDFEPINRKSIKTKIRRLEKKYEKYYSLYTGIYQSYDDSVNETKRLRGEVMDIRDKIDKLLKDKKKGVCPFCKRPMHDLEKIDKAILSHEKVIKNLKVRLALVIKNTLKYKKIGSYKRKYDAAKIDIDLLKTRLSRVMVAIRHNTKINRSRTICDNKVKKYDNLIKKYKKLEEIFGHNGYRKYLISSAIDRITTEMNSLLSMVSNIRVSFFIERTKFDIRIKRGGKKLDKRSLSGGEKKLLSILFNLSLVNVLVGRNIDCVFYDEILAELDEKNGMLAVETLSNVAKNLGIKVFVITNQKYIIENCNEYISGKVRVEMKKDSSRIYQEAS